MYGMSKNNGKAEKNDKAKRLRDRLKGRPHDDFYVAITGAIQQTEVSAHPNKQEALTFISQAITLHDRKTQVEDIRSRLCLFMAGVMCNDRLPAQVWGLIAANAPQVPKNRR